MANELKTISSYTNQGIKTDLKITEDRLKAFINSELENPLQSQDQLLIDWELFKTEICNWLEAHLDIDLIDNRALSDTFSRLKAGTYSIDRKIAQGVKPGAPRDGKIIFLVKPFSKSFSGAYSLKEKFQKHFDSVRKGDFIFRKYEPKEGSPGKEVSGKVIVSTQGKQVEIHVGDGIELLTSENSFTIAQAMKDGYILKEANAVSVCETLTIDTDVDHKTGSITFVGSISILGSVKKGFSVHAEKELTVEGDCYDARLESIEKSIIIRGKIIGDDTIEHFSPETLESHALVKIQAKEEVHAHTVQSQAIFSFGSITINQNASRCLLSSANSIRIGDSLFAARVRTVCGIEVGILGNKSGAPNFIELLNPEQASREYMILLEKKDMLLEQQRVLSVFLGPYLENPLALKRLQSNHRNKIESSLKTLIDLNKQIEKIDTLIIRSKQHSKKSLFSRVNIHHKIFPGTRIIADDQEFYFSKEEEGPASILYDFTNKAFTRTVIAPLQCTFEEQSNEKET
jgi:uncharacterized protein (DUF342 family)